MDTKESKKEIKACEIIEAELQADETLLEYTSASLVLGSSVFSRQVHIGLTPKRLLLVLLKGKKPTGKTYSIYRDHIKSISWGGLWSVLKIGLEKDTVNIPCRGSWRKRARSLILKHNEVAVEGRSPGELIDAAYLEQIQDLYELGFLSSGKAELEQAANEVASLNTNPAAQDLKQLIAESSLSLLVGGLFFFGNLLVLLLLAALGIIVLNPFGLLIAIIATVQLLRGVNQWRGAGIALAIINALLLGLSFMSVGSFLDTIMWFAFGAATVLVLIGKPKRTRIYISIAIYVIGFVIPLILGILVGIGNALMVA